MISQPLNLFSNVTSPVSFEEITKHKIQGKFFKVSITSGLIKLSEKVELSFDHEDLNYPFDYNLSVLNVGSKSDKSLWQHVVFNITSDLNLKFAIDSELGECLIWEWNRDFFVISNDSNTNLTQNLKLFVENFTRLISSYLFEIPVEKTDDSESKKNILVYGEVGNLHKFIQDNYKHLNEEVEEESKQDKKNIEELVDQFSSKVKISAKKVCFANFEKAYPSAKILFEAKGKLLRYLIEDDKLETMSEYCIFKVFVKDGYDYYIVIDDPAEIEDSLIIVKVNVSANINFQNKDNLVMFILRYQSDQVDAFNFLFAEKEKMDSAKKILIKSQYETANNNTYDDLKDEDKKWLEDYFEDDQGDEESKEINVEIENEFQEKVSDLNNKFTSQAYLHDRTFVFRENNSIGVYKTDEDDVLNHLMNLPPVVGYNDKKIDISSAQMYLSDTSMVLLDKLNPNTSYRYDLTKGTIVEEWNAKGVSKVNSIIGETKFGQMSESQLIQGVSKNSLFTMDGRINDKNKIVQSKVYKTNPQLETIASTDFGGIVVGSVNGEIRLYKKIGQNAKTLLPGFGDPIIAIDVTADGKWVLATCQYYLILIPTTCKGESNGFLTPMGKEKPKPRALKLKPIDIAKYKISNISFTPARFNVNQKEGETNIITSTGDYIINWNFSKVVKGITDDYKIKKANENILDSQFKFNKGQIVVTMDSKLRIQNQKYF